ncbi:MAG: ABC transporter ATP-binding protein [Gordonia sp. (in: high G+C Gram-positive bacteria)]
MIEVKSAVVRFGDATAVDGASVAVDDGAVLGIVGPNGSGKTTLLRAIAGLQRLDSGSVRIDDHAWETRAVNPSDLARRVALVTQHQDSPGQLRVIESVMLGRIALRGPWSRFTDEDWDVAERALRRVRVTHLVDRTVGSLSGGERQRVALARAITQGAPHLLLDEPTNHLDVRFQHELLDLVRELGATTIAVLHDLNLAGRYCDRLTLLRRGAVVASGEPGRVLDPDLIRDVYEIDVARHDRNGRPHLYFAPEPALD